MTKQMIGVHPTHLHSWKSQECGGVCERVYKADEADAEIERLQAELARLQAANKARADWLNGKKATAADEYIDLAEQQIAALKAGLEEIAQGETCDLKIVRGIARRVLSGDSPPAVEPTTNATPGAVSVTEDSHGVVASLQGSGGCSERYLQPRYVLEQIMNHSTDTWAQGVARTCLMHSSEKSKGDST